jgi:hypothetical protein
MNQYNHYTAEIGGERLKFCQVRKTINNNYQVVDKVEETCGYELNKWFTLYLHITPTTTTLLLGPKGEAAVEMMRVPFEGEFKDGKAALLTFKTNAGFNNFQMMPAGDSTLKLGAQSKHLK